ncbi:GIY-YIG nuclease family protein [Desulfonatronum parangueonense]
MITLHKILEIYGVDTTKVRIVRHGNKEIPILRTFQENLRRLEVYQSYQRPRKFGDANTIAVFAPYFKTTALFIGLWDILGCTDNSKFKVDNLLELQRFSLPECWYNDHVKYDLKRNTILDELSERIVIEWGAATVSWVQNKDKEIVELKGKKSIGDFQSFAQVHLTYQELKIMTQYPDTNLTWIKALSSVNGVYMIQDTLSGKLYVGSAYGDKGIYGRWITYAQNGHGGNLELQYLDSQNFVFSVLEIVSATSTADEVINYENRWKKKLGTTKFGLNKN